MEAIYDVIKKRISTHGVERYIYKDIEVVVKS
jgi:hypothetical protein